MSTIKLQAKQRKSEESLRELRADFMLPGVVYGHNVDSISITVPLKEFMKAYKIAGESTLIDLEIDGKEPVKVLVQAIDRNVKSNTAMHVDFYQVNMNEKLNADIPIIFEGESAAVKTQGGTLLTPIASIPVKCLPGDLVDSFKIDISVLDDFSKRISIEDIPNIPESMEVLKPMDSNVALVVPPRVAEVDVVAEEEEGEEGEGEKSAEGEAKEGEAPAEEKAKEPAEANA